MGSCATKVSIHIALKNVSFMQCMDLQKSLQSDTALKKCKGWVTWGELQQYCFTQFCLQDVSVNSKPVHQTSALTLDFSVLKGEEEEELRFPTVQFKILYKQACSKETITILCFSWPLPCQTWPEIYFLKFYNMLNSNVVIQLVKKESNK